MRDWRSALRKVADGLRPEPPVKRLAMIYIGPPVPCTVCGLPSVWRARDTRTGAIKAAACTDHAADARRAAERATRTRMAARARAEVLRSLGMTRTRYGWE